MLLLALALAAQGGPYDADPKHPWNELHQALFTWRPVPLARIPVGDEPEQVVPIKLPAGLQPDPLFWPPGKERWTFSAALLPILDRFLEKQNDALLKDPLKRAILQHDLWMFFDGLGGMPVANTGTWPPEDEAARDGARRRIARLMKRIALTSEEIRALPDNLAAAAASGRHASTFDPSEPERPFLPTDLADPKGPWVLLGREDGAPAAELHVTHFRGRSAFLIYASLPAGPEATLEFIRELGALKKAKPPEASPPGSRLLFVRRAFLLDADGRPHLSPLTEEIRTRVSQKEPGKGSGGVFEFHLNRGDLLAGVAGGLRAAGAEEEGVLFFFNRGSSKEKIRTSCKECHGNRVLPAATSRYGGRDPRTREVVSNGIPMRSTTVDQEAEATMKWKQADKSWDTLRRFWPKE